MLAAGVVLTGGQAMAAARPGPTAAQGTAAAAGGHRERGAVSFEHRAGRDDDDDASGDLSTVLTESGSEGYTSAGIGMRNLGYGTIDITGVPDGATVESAVLLWDVLGESPDPSFADGTVDGQAVTGTAWASGASPCWDGTSANYSYEADVTSLVTGNGAYDLADFASGDTDGSDPWDVGSDPPLLEGASLVVIYSGDSLPQSTIQIAAGAAETDSDNPTEATLDGFTVGDSPTVTTTYIVADGQMAGNTASFDGTVLPDVSFPGAAPQAAPDYSQGNLWDNVTTDVTDEVEPGDTSADLSVNGGEDCLVWVGQVLDVAQPCQQVTQADGDYDFGGCVAAEDDGTQDVTDSQSNLDGMDVSASPSDEVTYDDGGSAGDVLTSAGDSTLSLDLGGTQIPVDTAELDDSLTGPITFDVAGDDIVRPVLPRSPRLTASGGASVAGMPITGKLTFTPQLSGGKPDGTAKATVGTTLPPALGGGKATLTATSTVNKGITGVTVTAEKASFLQLFTLTKVKLSYAASSGGTATWTVSATASGGTALSGTLVYDGNELESASLSLGSISLAGLVKLSKLDIQYSDGSWSGDATIGSGASASSAKIALQFDDSGLSAATLEAANVSLFGVFDVRTFKLSYGDDSWSIAIAAADGGGASGTMTADDGAITAARLTVTKLSFLGKFTVDSATVSYAQDAPNSACDDVDGTEIWCGDWQVQLPQASTINGVSGSLAVADGEFAHGSIEVRGNVPLLDGIFLTKLGGAVTVNPPPTTIKGDAGLSFGPKIKGTSLLAFEGKLTRTLPGDDTSGSYALDGSLDALGALKGDVLVTVPGDGSATTVDLTASATAGKHASAAGELKGSFTASSFTVTGSVEITVLGHSVDGSLAADDKGMAACGKYKGHEAGFEYSWDTGDVTFLGTSGCSEKGF